MLVLSVCTYVHVTCSCVQIHVTAVVRCTCEKTHMGSWLTLEHCSLDMKSEGRVWPWPVGEAAESTLQAWVPAASPGSLGAQFYYCGPQTHSVK
jgi:hypothetical protein